ncbi:MAG: sporulation YhaL family protein [Sporolactobacillus sp.]
MKQVRRSLFAIGLLFVLFLAQQFGVLGSLISRMGGITWWVYLVIAGILFSGYQAYSLTKEEKAIDEGLNEQQGDVYMKRMEDEKKRRRETKQTKVM